MFKTCVVYLHCHQVTLPMKKQVTSRKAQTRTMKVNKEYTPGDWSVDIRNDVISEDGKRVCMVSDWNNLNSHDPYPKANAQLIAAAPTLVKAIIGQARVRAAEYELTQLQPTYKGTPQDLDRRCQHYADKNWKYYLTSFSLAALIQAGVLTIDQD